MIIRIVLPLFNLTDFATYYGLKSVYPWFLWMMIAVGVLPIFVWFFRRIFPHVKWLRYVHIPIVLLSTFNLQYTGYGYLIFPTWFLLGFIFLKVIRRWWFDRYGFLFTISMTMGTAVAQFFIFFIFNNNHIIFPEWWGTKNDTCPLALASANGSTTFE